MFHESDPSLQQEMRDLIRYWIKARGDRTLPARSAIDFTKLQDLLPDLSVIELHTGARRFFVAHHGQSTRSRIGDDMTNRYIEDVLAPDVRIIALAPYIEAADRKLPTHSLMIPKLYAGVFTRLERLVLPFCNEDGDNEVTCFLAWVGKTDRTAFDMTSVYDKLSALPDPETGVKDLVTLRVLAA